MSVIDENLRSTHLSGVLERDGDSAKIAYGYNAGGRENSLYFITSGGEVIGIDTVIAKIKDIDFTDSADPDWYITGSAVNEEDSTLIDSHTGQQIPAVYE